MRGLIKLSEAITEQSIHFLSDKVRLAVSARSIKVAITRTGDFTDPRYDNFNINLPMLQEMKRNFDNNAFGQEIILDLSHEPEKGGAGVFKSLSIEPYRIVIDGQTITGHKLLGVVDLTSYGIDAIKNRNFIYLSAEFHPSFVSNETGKNYGAVLQGAALTPRPVIKHLDKVQLSEQSLYKNPTFIDVELANILHEENAMKWTKLLAELMATLGSMKLSDAVVNQIKALAESLLAKVEDEVQAKIVLASLHGYGVTLSEAMSNDKTVSVDTSGLEKLLASITKPTENENAGLTADEVKKILAESLTDRDNAVRDQKTLLAGNVKAYDDIIAAAEGLGEADVKRLASAHSLITHTMTVEQVKALAERELENANELIAARKLSEMGAVVHGPSGVVRLSQTHSNDAVQLQSIQHEHLRRTNEFRSGKLRLAEDKTLAPFVQDTLAMFDTINASKISMTVRKLADGVTNVSDTDLPVGYQREVIREALSDLNILMLVSTYTDPDATATTLIPYELRDTDKVVNDAIVYERQAIPKAGMKQMMDLAYVNAMKIAIDVSNEVIHFTQASGINWDAWARNISSAARLMRELLSRRIANAMQRHADSFAAVVVTAENIAAQVDGSGDVVKTALFPIVEPHQVFDLQGNAVGTAENPITLSIGGSEIFMYNGSGAQAGGTYYRVVNYNLGYIQFVTELGAQASPNNAVATVSYSRATNILLADSDVPANTKKEVHLNKLLQKVGAAKAILDSQRYVAPDYMLMSATLHNEATDAEQFSANFQRNDANISVSGDLGPVKGVAAFKTNGPNIHLGDERILLGQRGVASYTIAKPWMMGEPVEARNSNGQLIGAKESYGEEYNSIHVPVPLRGRFTSILWYSASNR